MVPSFYAFYLCEIRLPGRVEHGYRKRAYFVWGSLVVILIGYSFWVVYAAILKRENPSVSITVKVCRVDSGVEVHGRRVSKAHGGTIRCWTSNAL